MSEEITKTEPTSELTKTTTADMLLDAAVFDRVKSIAAIMASGKCAIPKHLQGNVGDCFAVILQAMQWRLSPFVVAQKTHIVNGALGYESQLVNSICTSSGAIRDRFRYEYVGDWEGYRKSGYAKSAETGCGINVGATLAGESELRWLPAPLYMENVKTRNSPLWSTNPQQQIAYLAVKNWVRLYAPDAILGVYSTDELADGEPINVTPVSATSAPAKPESESARRLKEACKKPEPVKPEKPLTQLIAEDIAERHPPVSVGDIVGYIRDHGVKDVDAPECWSPGRYDAFRANISSEIDKIAGKILAERG